MKLKALKLQSNNCMPLNKKAHGYLKMSVGFFMLAYGRFNSYNKRKVKRKGRSTKAVRCRNRSVKNDRRGKYIIICENGGSAMFCRKCGHEIEEDALFCTYCGTKVEPVHMRVQDMENENNKKLGTGNHKQEKKPVQKPEKRPVQNSGKRPGKKKKTGMILLIVIICLLTIAIIAGAILFFLTQQNKTKQVEAFKSDMSTFEALLENYNYGSIHEEVQKLLRDCETAVKEKAVDNFEALKKRMTLIREELERISEEIGTLEELKSTYTSRLENYEIPEALQELTGQVLDELQDAIDNGDVNLLATIKEKLKDLEGQLKDENLEILSQIFGELSEVDTGQFKKEIVNEIEAFLDEIQEFQDAGDYKNAIAKARELLEFADKAQAQAQRERNESIMESEAESMRKAQEEARQSATTGDSGYLCPESSSRYLTESDLKGFSDWELMMAINEIYARHGRLFKDTSIQDYFNQKSWYNGYVQPDDFDVSVFNVYEKANIEFIKEYE